MINSLVKGPENNLTLASDQPHHFFHSKTPSKLYLMRGIRVTLWDSAPCPLSCGRRSISKEVSQEFQERRGNLIQDHRGAASASQRNRQSFVYESRCTFKREWRQSQHSLGVPGPSFIGNLVRGGYGNVCRNDTLPGALEMTWSISDPWANGVFIIWSTQSVRKFPKL